MISKQYFNQYYENPVRLLCYKVVQAIYLYLSSLIFKNGNHSSLLFYIKILIIVFYSPLENRTVCCYRDFLPFNENTLAYYKKMKLIHSMNNDFNPNVALLSSKIKLRELENWSKLDILFSPSLILEYTRESRTICYKSRKIFNQWQMLQRI